MSLYVIVSADFVKTGGQDRANLALASYLARQGHELHLVSHSVDEELRGYENVFVHPAPRPLGSAFLGEGCLDRVGRAVAQTLAPRGARVIVNGGNCAWGDVNWVHYVHAAYERRAAGLVRRVRYKLAHARFLERERRAMSCARFIVANSKRTARDLRERLNVERDRIRVIYYGTDSQAFRPLSPASRITDRAAAGFRHGRPSVLFVGTLGDDRKGFDTAFRAWEILCADSRWDADLFVAGRVARLHCWERRARARGLGDRVHFLGLRADVPRLVGAADALISPTRYEPYGLAVHEAICCGIPAFVSDAAGVAERYPNELKHLLLPDADDAADLAKRLRAWRADLRRDREALVPFSDELRSRTWDDMAADIVAQIDSPRSAHARAEVMA